MPCIAPVSAAETFVPARSSGTATLLDSNQQLRSFVQALAETARGRRAADGNASCWDFFPAFPQPTAPPLVLLLCSARLRDSALSPASFVSSLTGHRVPESLPIQHRTRPHAHEWRRWLPARDIRKRHRQPSSDQSDEIQWRSIAGPSARGPELQATRCLRHRRSAPAIAPPAAPSTPPAHESPA